MGSKFLPGENDMVSTNHYLLKEWHPTKNIPLTPDQVMPGTGKKIWWLCTRGHEFLVSGNSRVTFGSGCPYCANKKVWAGFNDLATTAPGLLRDWDFELNVQISPQEVTLRSGKMVWWKCSKNHSWQATPDARTGRKTGCPVCQNLKLLVGYNDLASRFPKIASEFDVAKNGVTPEQVIAGAAKRAWWLCPEGHSYSSTVDSRCQQGLGCPYCSNRYVLDGWNDIASKNPTLLSEWHPTANLPLTPNQVQAGSAKKVWWLCPAGHEYKSVVYNRHVGIGCSSCAETGYRPDKKGVLYFLESQQLKARKIGITNYGIRTDRVRQFVSKGWKVIRLFIFESGGIPPVLEKQVLSWLREDNNMPQYLAKGDLGHLSGESETFSMDGISNEAIIEKILILSDDVGSSSPVNE